MKRKLLGLTIAVATLATPVVVARPAVACVQCEEQGVMSLIRYLSSGLIWR